jgi:hypothetical protein
MNSKLSHRSSVVSTRTTPDSSGHFARPTHVAMRSGGSDAPPSCSPWDWRHWCSRWQRAQPWRAFCSACLASSSCCWQHCAGRRSFAAYRSGNANRSGLVYESLQPPPSGPLPSGHKTAGVTARAAEIPAARGRRRGSAALPRAGTIAGDECTLAPIRQIGLPLQVRRLDVFAILLRIGAPRIEVHIAGPAETPMIATLPQASDRQLTVRCRTSPTATWIPPSKLNMRPKDRGRTARIRLSRRSRAPDRQSQQQG